MTITDALTLAMKTQGHGKVRSDLLSVSLAARGLHAAMRGVGLAAGIAGGGLTAIGVLAVKTAADFQTMQFRLDAVMGSAAAGKQAFAWLLDMEPKLPGTLGDITKLFTLMQSFKLNPQANMTTVLDATLGDMESAQRMIMALGKMKNTRVVQGDELNQLIEGSNIPAIEIIANAFKLTEKQLSNIGNVRIPADSAIKAILDWAKENRGGASERQMAGIAGKLSSLISAKDKFLNAVGMAISPTVIKMMDAVTAWLSDPKTIGAALKFTSYLVAGLRVAATMAQQLMDTIFNRKDAPVWLLQIKKGMLDIAKTVLALVTVRDVIKGGFNKRPGDVIAAILTGMTGVPMLDQMSKNTDAQIAAAMEKGGEGAHPKVADVFRSDQQSLYAQFMADYAKTQDAGTGGLPGVVPGTSPAASSPVENALQKIVEQQILGGAERARRGIKGMDLIRGSVGRPKPTLTIRFETVGKSMDKMVEDAVSKGIRKWVESGGPLPEPAR